MTLLKVYTKSIVVRNHLVELNKEADSPCPITFEFKRLHRSSRLAAGTKRSYEATQGLSKRTAKLLKRPKLTVDKPATDLPATKDPPINKSTTDEPPADEPHDNPTSLKSVEDTAVIQPNTMEPLHTSGEATLQENTNELMAKSTLASPIDGDETTSGGAQESNPPIITYTSRITILDKYFS